MIKTLGGIISVFSAIYFLTRYFANRKKVSVCDKVVVITGASSGIGEGNYICVTNLPLSRKAGV